MKAMRGTTAVADEVLRRTRAMQQRLAGGCRSALLDLERYSPPMARREQWEHAQRVLHQAMALLMEAPPPLPAPQVGADAEIERMLRDLALDCQKPVEAPPTAGAAAPTSGSAGSGGGCDGGVTAPATPHPHTNPLWAELVGQR